MRPEPLAVASLLLFGVAAVIAGPKMMNKARRTVHRATGTTFRSGVSTLGARAAADPARGLAA